MQAWPERPGVPCRPDHHCRGPKILPFSILQKLSKSAVSFRSSFRRRPNHRSSPAHRCIRPPPTRIMSNEERNGAPIPQTASSPLQDAPILHWRHRGLRQFPGSGRRFRFFFAGCAQSSTAGDLVPFMPMHSSRFPLVSHRHASTRGPRRRGGRRSRRL